ncbi:N-6 DNA methylase [uncultured Desulfovibrio sp.]|uniref:N-6 DNA methylase n=1 Tax=uncultured Desulfovibrio sp. TaxID=167968 RepID=UPI00265D492D|nr:N-6 DNA methylase [uncultured Desulfovibrio sp.]
MSKKHYQRGNPGLNPVRKELETIIGMGYRSHRVFEDWVGLMFHAFQRDDPPYLEIMGGYRNTAPRGQREADHFATATACLLEYMRATNEEILGPLYEEYAANHYTGQYFTPSAVARLMASITHIAPPETGRFKVLDPACGAGACLIAAAKEQTFEQNGRAVFVGQDIDLTCVRMTALNLMFFNLDTLPWKYAGHGKHGGAWSGEEASGRWTRKRRGHGWKATLPDRKRRQRRRRQAPCVSKLTQKQG